MTHCTQYRALGVRPLDNLLEETMSHEVLAFRKESMSSIPIWFPNVTTEKKHVLHGRKGTHVCILFVRDGTQYGIVVKIVKFAKKRALVVIGSDYVPIRALDDVCLPVPTLHVADYEPPKHLELHEKVNLKALWELLKTECYEELHQAEEAKWMRTVRVPQYGVRSTSRRPSGKPR